MSGANPSRPPSVGPENVQICGDSLPHRCTAGSHARSPGELILEPWQARKTVPGSSPDFSEARPTHVREGPAGAPHLPRARRFPVSIPAPPLYSKGLPALPHHAAPGRVPAPPAPPRSARRPAHAEIAVLEPRGGTSHAAPRRHTNARTLSADRAPGGPLARMGWRTSELPRRSPASRPLRATQRLERPAAVSTPLAISQTRLPL